MSYITLLAKIIAKPGCEAKLLPELQAMVKPSKAEDGCLKYVLYSALNDSRTFWFVEEWKSEEALTEHNLTPHYKRLKERIADLVEAAELTRLVTL